MQEPEFAPGQIVYTADGRRVSFVSRVADGYVVQPLMPHYHATQYFDYEEEIPTGVEMVPVVYEKFTEAKIDENLAKRIAEAEAQLATVSQKLKDAREEWWLFERDEKNRLERMKRHEALAHLDEFIKGEITHYVAIDSLGMPSLIAFDATDPHERDLARWTTKKARLDHSKLRLLALFGNANGDLAWGLNRYRDGSGDWQHVIPCMSIEEAKKIIQERIDAAFEEILGGKHAYLKSWVESAKKNYIEVPQAIRDLLQAELVEQARGYVATTEDRVEEAKKMLARVENGEKVDIPYYPPRPAIAPTGLLD